MSQNGVPEFDYMDSVGRMHHLTIADNTLENLAVAIDEENHTWTLDQDTQDWMREFIRPDMTGSYSVFSGWDRADYNEFNAAKLEQQVMAKQKFDSSTIQSELPQSKTYEYHDYGRLHNPTDNMIKAYIDYAKWKASHS